MCFLLWADQTHETDTEQAFSRFSVDNQQTLIRQDIHNISSPWIILFIGLLTYRQMALTLSLTSLLDCKNYCNFGRFMYQNLCLYFHRIFLHWFHNQIRLFFIMGCFIYNLDSSNSSSFTFWSSQFTSSSRSNWTGIWTGIWTSNSNGSWTDTY